MKVPCDIPLKKIIEADLCSGCGVCAGICPAQCLVMSEIQTGEYRPELITDTCTQCGLCEKVCPFGRGPNEDEIGKTLWGGRVQKTNRGGYVLSAVCGGLAEDDLRLKRTSGGLGVWLLAKLLESGYVDRVISVRSCSDSGRLFEFSEFSTAEDVYSSAKSCYYPVELSECLARVRNVSLRYAVVGVPCLIKALQKARRLNKKLNDNIVVTVGLVCSCQKTKFFSEYLIRRADINPEKVVGFSFRMKDGVTPADNCLMVRIKTTDGEDRVVRHEEYAKLWGGGLFSMKACGFCDDHFAETADIALMDAKHLTGPLGATVAIVRSLDVRNLLIDGRRGGQLALEEISFQDAFDCQNGCDHWKRVGAAYMLSRYKGMLPEGFAKRVAPSRKNALHFMLKDGRRIASIKAFEQQRGDGPGLDLFWHEYNKRTRVGRTVELLRDFKKLLLKIIQRIKRK